MIGNARKIDTNFNGKKATGTDEVSPGLLKELSQNGVIVIKYLFNAFIRLEFAHESSNITPIVMLKKPK